MNIKAAFFGKLNTGKAIPDKAIPVKVQFFQDVASQLKGFLHLFQTSNPMSYVELWFP